MTPSNERANYQLYPGKPCVSHTAEGCAGCRKMRIASVGKTLQSDNAWADPPHFRNPIRAGARASQAHWSSGPAAQRSSSPAVQRSGDPAVQWSSGPAVQRSRGPAVQRSSGPAVQRSAHKPKSSSVRYSLARLPLLPLLPYLIPYTIRLCVADTEFYILFPRTLESSRRVIITYIVMSSTWKPQN
eukprot:1103867-Pyramimonas_sp.AAC.1